MLSNGLARGALSASRGDKQVKKDHFITLPIAGFCDIMNHVRPRPQNHDQREQMMINQTDLIAEASDLTHWVPSRELPKMYPQFTASQMKALLWKRQEHVGLSRCCRMVGARLYVNTKLLGYWLAGALPEQQAADE